MQRIGTDKRKEKGIQNSEERREKREEKNIEHSTFNVESAYGGNQRNVEYRIRKTCGVRPRRILDLMI
ncbi:MAG: hypothetical protein KAT56_11375 [Sedimentisphaerales bacterium]|nr:hypothetical protein [Sedimentisphaerales bacterium]